MCANYTCGRQLMSHCLIELLGLASYMMRVPELEFTFLPTTLMVMLHVMGRRRLRWRRRGRWWRRPLLLKQLLKLPHMLVELLLLLVVMMVRVKHPDALICQSRKDPVIEQGLTVNQGGSQHISATH